MPATKLAQTAIVYQHPSAKVIFDPPVTRESIRAAVEASNAERAEVNRLTSLDYPMHPTPEERDAQLEQVALIDVFSKLIEHHGYDRVSRLLRFAGHMKGVA